VARWLVVALLALALGCQPSAAGPAPTAAPAAAPAPSGDTWEQVVAAAQQEGHLTLITNPGHRGVIERATPLFQQEYGIDVEVTYLNGREATERLLAEVGAGQVRTDAIVSGDSNIWSVAQMGVLESYTVPNTAAISDRLRPTIGPDNTYYPQMLNVYGLVVNTQVIPPERIPRRWADLVDPYYRGKIIVHNPGTTGGGNTWLAAANEAPGLGRPYLEKIAQQDVIIVQDPAGVEAAVARGERGVGVPAGGRSVVTQPGAPLKWVVPEEGVAFSVQTVAIPKQAPRPNAARVWVNFMLTKQVQEWWYDIGHYTPVRTDVDLDTPEYNLANLPLLGGTGYRPPDEAPQSLSLGKAIFGQ
jgi:iron(III) transport system substrate-binding protein